jgi:hypothetical protein
LDISPIWTVPLSQQKKKKTTSFSVDYVWKLCFHVRTVQTVRLFSDHSYSDSTLILTIAVNDCTDIGARPRVWSFSNDFNVCLNSCGWFMLCLVYIYYLVLVLMSG